MKYNPATANMHSEPIIDAAPGQIIITIIGGLKENKLVFWLKKIN
jgi:hypothetical protein